MIIRYAKGSLGTPSITKKYDYWARHQFILELNATDKKRLTDVFADSCSCYTTLIDSMEIQRLMDNYKKTENINIRKELRQKYDLELTLPKGFQIVKRDENAVSLKFETEKVTERKMHQIIQGILIYVKTYGSIADLLDSTRIISFRDAVTREYVPGNLKDTYMKVAGDHYRPHFREIHVKGRKATETRGLWEMKGYFMGGPFINVILHDEKAKRLIMLDGYVFAPNFDKRELLRQLEAVIHTLVL